jgi:hypothetical protein
MTDECFTLLLFTTIRSQKNFLKMQYCAIITHAFHSSQSLFHSYIATFKIKLCNLFYSLTYVLLLSLFYCHIVSTIKLNYILLFPSNSIIDVYI